jgi:hypothetical protein
LLAGVADLAIMNDASDCVATAKRWL